MTTLRTALALGMLAAGPATAFAQATGPQPGPADRCAAARAWLTAEETTPGILQRMAREALAECLAAAPAATTTIAAPATPGR
jgi:hypothetical protein